MLGIAGEAVNQMKIGFSQAYILFIGGEMTRWFFYSSEHEAIEEQGCAGTAGTGILQMQLYWKLSS